MIHYIAVIILAIVLVVNTYYAGRALKWIWSTSQPKFVKVGCSCEYFTVTIILAIGFGMYLRWIIGG